MPGGAADARSGIFREKLMNILMTGATGFVGSHLIEYLLKKEKDTSIFATRRHRSNLENVQHLLKEKRVRWLPMDITDSHSVSSVIKESKPDWCFHLCAQSFVPASWNAQKETMMSNVIGTIDLLEGMRILAPGASIQIAGSSEEYGMCKEEEMPIKEENTLRPLSPYAVSKVAEDLLGYQYSKSYGQRIIRTRGFNHTGPRRGQVFVCSDFARQIAEIEKGLREPVLYVGNLEAKRDFTDVRDMVKAYYLALEKGRAGDVYNICAGKVHSIQEILDLLLAKSKVKIKTEQDPSKMRPSDVPVLYGDSSKFRGVTGWEPKIPFETTLQDLLEFWRRKINV